MQYLQIVDNFNPEPRDKITKGARLHISNSKRLFENWQNHQILLSLMFPFKLLTFL